MKGIANFFSFVEIKTKLASTVPFLAGLGYTLYHCGEIDVGRTAVFFASMILFDMTTTAINNHMGTREQKQENHYPDGLSLALILGMLTAAVGLGIFLVVLTGPVVLLTGLFCFGVGILYSFGPLPIARTPFGEIFSGTVMGACIPFLVYTVNAPELLSLAVAWPRMTVAADLWAMLCLGICVAPMICCIANIMLANNTCDLEEDIKVGRYTLPFYLGKDVCLKLFKWLYAAALLFIILGVVMGSLPASALLGLVFTVPVMRNVQAFEKKQDKRETFDLSIKNFVMILIPYTAGLWLFPLWRILFR